MEYECILVRIRKILLSVEVSAILVRTDSTILQCIANPAPRLGTRRGDEATLASCGRTIGQAFEDVQAVPPKSADLSGDRLGNGCVRGSNLVVSTTAHDGLVG